MVEYYLASGTTPEELSDVVTEHLAAGWTLHGSPCSIKGVTGGLIYYQAVVR